MTVPEQMGVYFYLDKIEWETYLAREQICRYLQIQLARVWTTKNVLDETIKNRHPCNKDLAERAGFEPAWGGKAPIRFRVGAVMATSVPLLQGELMIIH